MTSRRRIPIRAHRPSRRRGNTIVLVSAILVLLVIVAAAFLSRTQAARTTARAISDSEQRSSKVRSIGESLAEEVALALFPLPIDPGDPEVQALRVASSSYPRLAPEPFATRYGIDRDAVVNATLAAGADGLADYPYNYAPYQVLPWTNWPDDLTTDWPQGLGAPNGRTMVGSVLLAERNPVGNPGFGDARWLADAEPLRWATGALASFGFGHYLDAYSHWRHLTNIARPNNAFRIVTDLADVFDLGPDGVPSSGDEDGLGILLSDLDVPVEQWLSIAPGGGSFRNGYTGDTVLPGDIENRFGNWFLNYRAAYADPSLTPPNFLKLNDLNADGVVLEPGDRPEDEFIPGTRRWAISRFLADTDGDGYTDSFWFMAPGPIDRGIRQIVAVRITDNGGQVYANGATRFDRLSTQGATPADVALVGQNATFAPGSPSSNWNTGLFDLPANDEGQRVVPIAPPYTLYPQTTQRWNPSRWGDLLVELGITAPLPFFAAANTSDAAVRNARLNRLAYWQASGRRPLAASLQLNPFGLGDELELRMYHGQNHPWILSRFEKAVGGLSSDYAILRSGSNTAASEATEYGFQLRNRELLYDLRSKITLHNGARNDEMPPWLRWRWDLPPGLVAGTPAAFNFERQTRRRLDLREEPLPPLRVGEGTFRDRLAPTILLALLDGYAAEGQSYFGPYPAAGSPPIVPAVPDPQGILQRNRRLAAGLAANVLEARDEDQTALLFDDPGTTGVVEGAVLVPRLGTYPLMEPESKPIAFLGMEVQPFLLEAFVGHVYKSYEVPPADLLGTPWLNAGARVVFDNPDFRTSIAVVQIANPYDVPIDLTGYSVELFGERVSLGSLPALAPGTPERPNTLILYAMNAGFEGGDVKTKWIDFLDLLPGDFVGASATCLVDVNAGTWACDGVTGTFPSFAGWSTARQDYDESDDPAVVLLRQDPLTGAQVVIDRMDPPDEDERDFGDAVNDLTEVADIGDPLTLESQPPFGSRFGNPGEEALEIAAPGEAGDWYWAVWARATRAWGVDVDNDGAYGKAEWNPRYVFGGDKGRTVTVGALPSTPGVSPALQANYVAEGNRFDFALLPDGDPAGTGEPWFVRDYHTAGGVLAARKPTFFDMNPGSGIGSYPDKGWYGQGVDDNDGNGVADATVEVDDVPTAGLFLAPYSMQMLRKDADFVQVGELLNTWTFGHELRLVDNGGVLALDVSDPDDGGTVTTFSEFMTRPELVGEGPRVNRLQPFRQVYDGDEIGAIAGRYDPSSLSALNRQRLATPTLPAGLRVLDAFVCDGPGIATLTDSNLDGVIDQGDVEARRLYNAQGFSGQATPGLLNVNTASLEALRTLPGMFRMIHALNSSALLLNANPRVAVPEALVHYRERHDGTVTGVPGGPDYNDPSADDLWADRSGRGVATASEIVRLTRPAQTQLTETSGQIIPPERWLAAAGALLPFGDPDDLALVDTARDVIVSTDVTPVYDVDTGLLRPDRVSGDVEEANLLYAGLSNLVTTRSDVFTVHFRVRSFRQSETTGRWDALDRDAIVDDSRYVMLVDRSAVNRPGERPRILFLEKLPN